MGATDTREWRVMRFENAAGQWAEVASNHIGPEQLDLPPGYRFVSSTPMVPAEQLQAAEDDLGAIGHAFLAYENAPLADRGTYRAELLAKVREIGERRGWVAEVGHA